MEKETVKDLMVKVAESDMEIHVKAAVMAALANKAEDECKIYSQMVKEGDVVKIKDEIYIVAQIIDSSRRYSDFCTNPVVEVAIIYNPIRKDLDIVHENYYSNPDMCQIISHIDPGMIFREDVKCV